MVIELVNVGREKVNGKFTVVSLDDALTIVDKCLASSEVELQDSPFPDIYHVVVGGYRVVGVVKVIKK